MSLAQLVRDSKEIDVIAAQLDGLDHAGRMQEISKLTRADQARLFELSAGRACSLATDFVPAGKPPLTEVIHWGYNSLAMFRTFQKRFCWPAQPHVPKIAIGYNEQAMKFFTGPGFFVAREDTSESGVLTVVVDYKLLPDEKPESWPTILPNTARLSRFVYNGTRDWMWKVSRHVTIGRARRDAGWMDNWFVLCRED
jgi:hypothetical protein